eukprot:1002248-Pyramimonas_sp.AAC.1
MERLEEGGTGGTEPQGRREQPDNNPCANEIPEHLTERNMRMRTIEHHVRARPKTCKEMRKTEHQMRTDARAEEMHEALEQQGLAR